MEEATMGHNKSSNNQPTVATKTAVMKGQQSTGGD